MDVTEGVELIYVAAATSRTAIVSTEQALVRITPIGIGHAIAKEFQDAS